MPITASERFIVACYYAIGGLILGIALVLSFSLHYGLENHAFKIIIFSMLCCFVLGYFFPSLIGLYFGWILRWF